MERVAQPREVLLAPHPPVGRLHLQLVCKRGSRWLYPGGREGGRPGGGRREVRREGGGQAPSVGNDGWVLPRALGHPHPRPRPQRQRDSQVRQEVLSGAAVALLCHRETQAQPGPGLGPEAGLPVLWAPRTLPSACRGGCRTDAGGRGVRRRGPGRSRDYLRGVGRGRSGRRPPCPAASRRPARRGSPAPGRARRLRPRRPPGAASPGCSTCPGDGGHVSSPGGDAQPQASPAEGTYLAGDGDVGGLGQFSFLGAKVDVHRALARTGRRP